MKQRKTNQNDISKYEDELERLLYGKGEPVLLSNDPSIEEPSEFALERHLEDFLVKKHIGKLVLIPPSDNI